MDVAPQSSMAATSLRGFAFAGCRASMSGITEVTPSAARKRANSGKVDRSTSSSPKRYISWSIRTCEEKIAWVYSAPFGTPVLPEVKRMAARSSGADGSHARPSGSSRSSRTWPPQNHLRPTVTQIVTDASASRNTSRAT